MRFFPLFYAIGLLLMGLAIYFSPEGYEDEKGFHYGKNPNIKS